MLLFTYEGHNKKLRSVVSWKNFVISGGEDAKIRIWDVSFNSIDAYAVLVDHKLDVVCLYVHNDILFPEVVPRGSDNDISRI